MVRPINLFLINRLVPILYLKKHNRELCEVHAISAYEDDHIIYDVKFSDGFQYCVFDAELFMPKPDYKLLDSISRIQIM